MKADESSPLNTFLEEASLSPLVPALCVRFDDYLSLILRWNSRINLTAIRDKEGILRRHFVESIACAMALPSGIARLLDFGSGAGFPGIPIALCRPEIAVTLAESQNKKAAFLREAILVLGIAANVHGGRAESLTESFDCVILRAVDRMKAAAEAGARMVRREGWMALVTTAGDAGGLKIAVGDRFSWLQDVPLPGSQRRILAIGRKRA